MESMDTQHGKFVKHGKARESMGKAFSNAPIDLETIFTYFKALADYGKHEAISNICKSASSLHVISYE